MKKITALLLTITASCVWAEQQTTVSISGVLESNPCDISFSHDAIDFGTISYEEARTIDNNFINQPPDSLSINSYAWARQYTDIEFELSCAADTTLHVRMQDSVVAGDVHIENNVFGGEVVEAFTVWSSNGKPSGIVRFSVGEAGAPFTRQDNTVDYALVLFNYNKASSSPDAQALMGPFNLQAGRPRRLRLSPTLYLNVNALPASEETSLTASIDTQIIF